MIGELWRDGWVGRLILGLIASVPILIAIAIYAASWEEAKCTEMGGRMISKTSVGVGPAISPNGGVAVVPTTVSFCLSNDGRILF